jgi:hypothetical protein
VNTYPTEALSRLKTHWTILTATLCALLLSVIVHAIPTTHSVDIGGYDSAYVQGFYDQQHTPQEFGRNGTARWSGPDAAIRLPLLGRPAHITLRVAAPRAKTLDLISPTTAVTVPLQEPFRWYTVPFVESGSPTKWFDTAVTLLVPTGTWQKGDLRDVGILVDSLTYTTDWYALPYPSTVLLSMLVAGMASYLLTKRTHVQPLTAVALAAALPNIFVACAWRWPVSPLLVWSSALPWLGAGLFVAILWQLRAAVHIHWQQMQERYAAVAIVGWSIWMMFIQQHHVTLAVPGVEKDFRSFASRSDDIAAVLRADPFYHFGYPLILWIGNTLSGGSVFSVATVWAVCAATLAICAAWYCARRVLGRGWDLVAVGIMLSSSFFVEYTLLVGSDMTFTALVTTALAMILWAMDLPERNVRWVVVGLCVGAAFLVRHTGLILVVPVLCALYTRVPTRRALLLGLAFFGMGWVVSAAPQLVINVRDTGQLFFHHQAKNSWLAVYGNMDWGRWGDVPDNISLLHIFLMDPSRFVVSWWNNIVGVFGTGAVARETDTALWQRLLSVPMNWLSTVGVVWAGWMILQRRLDAQRWVLVAWAAGFIAVSSIAFILPRMMLPLVFVAAVSATDGVRLVTHSFLHIRWLVVAVLLVGVMVYAGDVGWQRIVQGQPADERAALMYMQRLNPQRLAVLVPAESPAGKYSALSERVVVRVTRYPVDPATVCAAQPDYALWSNELVPPDERLIPLERIGRYWIFRMADSPTFCTPS